jgi:hypothetical protein
MQDSQIARDAQFVVRSTVLGMVAKGQTYAAVEVITQISCDRLDECCAMSVQVPQQPLRQRTETVRSSVSTGKEVSVKVENKCFQVIREITRAH